jgi:prepilin signal peptidase PulO-like enzyme (type II secretory pathway)
MVSNIAIGAVADLYDSDPAGAEPVWSALDSVQNGLGGGNEIAGGVWVLLVSLAALKTNLLPAAVNYLGIAAGVAGLITVIPALEAVGAVFGIGLIVWFVWVGWILLTDDTHTRQSGTPERIRSVSES